MKIPDLQCSSYDVEHCGWSNLPEEDDFLMTDGYHWTMGEFVWTGFDYLGEPTPYYTVAQPLLLLQWWTLRVYPRTTSTSTAQVAPRGGNATPATTLELGRP